MDSLIQADVLKEIENAENRYGAFASSHEALGVLTEEVFELTGAIQKNSAVGIYEESIQVAAVCLRLAAQVEKSGTFFAGRSNL